MTTPTRLSLILSKNRPLAHVPRAPRHSLNHLLRARPPYRVHPKPASRRVHGRACHLQYPVHSLIVVPLLVRPQNLSPSRSASPPCVWRRNASEKRKCKLSRKCQALFCLRAPFDPFLVLPALCANSQGGPQMYPLFHARQEATPVLSLVRQISRVSLHCPAMISRYLTRVLFFSGAESTTQTRRDILAISAIVANKSDAPRAAHFAASEFQRRV